MSSNEIGSEFWLSEAGGSPRKASGSMEESYLLSGRTALDYMIEDMRIQRPLDSVSMPSYCCQSMLEPFVRNGIRIRFYEIRGGRDGFQPVYNVDHGCDAVVLLDYFGYENDALVPIAAHAKAAGRAVLYDATHKLNGHAAVEAYAEYTFCSYRKWFYSNAAAVRKQGRFQIEAPAVRNTAYEGRRSQAARLKHDYMAGLAPDKADYYKLFQEAEKLLEGDYRGYAAEPASVEGLRRMDFQRVATRRRENARRLMNGLRALEYGWLTLPVQSVAPQDDPLFVPILINPEVRDQVRGRLVEESIYCPVHWPLCKLHDMDGFSDSWKSIYRCELSLVCDQRYGPADMDRMLDVLKRIGDTIG